MVRTGKVDEGTHKLSMWLTRRRGIDYQKGPTA